MPSFMVLICTEWHVILKVKTDFGITTNEGEARACMCVPISSEGKGILGQTGHFQV